MSTEPAPISSVDELKKLPKPWFVVDLRDVNEIEAGKGGPSFKIDGSVNLPLNVDGVKQSERMTTLDEFRDKLAASGIALPDDKSASIVTHCGHGGRGGRGAAYFKLLGYENTLNGGGPANIAQALTEP